MTEPKCPPGTTGTPPNCTPIQTPQCPPGTTGTPPNCTPPQPGKLIITKVVNNDDQTGKKNPSDFRIVVNPPSLQPNPPSLQPNPPSLQGSGTVTINPGQYTILEVTQDPNYMQKPKPTLDCTGTISAGQTKKMYHYQ